MATNNSANIATAATGTVLQGQGVGTAPAFSTATYPSTAGSSGNVLTSDGTNWVSASSSSSFVLTSKVTLTSAQIKALSGTPITLISAPGANMMINIITVSSRFNYGGSNAFTGGSVINLYANSTVNSNYLSTAIFNTTVITGTSTTGQTRYPTASTFSGTDYTNQPVIVGVAGVDYAGNAANNNTIEIQVAYFISSL